MKRVRGLPTFRLLNWPVVYTNGDLRLSGGSADGRGSLIVTGTLTVATWSSY